MRFPRAEDLPSESHDFLSRVVDARITTGYIATNAADQPYSAYIEANVHAPDVFTVFTSLAFGLMPDIAAPLIGIKEEEPIFGPYTDRAWAVGVFGPYIDILQNDGFLEFGILHQSEFAFEEIFVASSKYFKIWTSNGQLAETILRSNNIPRCETLQFIDEYPMVSESIGPDGSAAWCDPYYSLQEEFNRLPPPNVQEA